MATNTNKDRMIIHVTPEYEERVEKLRKIAKIESRSLSYLARMSLDMFIDKYEKEKGVVQIGEED